MDTPLLYIPTICVAEIIGEPMDTHSSVLLVCIVPMFVSATIMGFVRTGSPVVSVCGDGYEYLPIRVSRRKSGMETMWMHVQYAFVKMMVRVVLLSLNYSTLVWWLRRLYQLVCPAGNEW